MRSAGGGSEAFGIAGARMPEGVKKSAGDDASYPSHVQPRNDAAATDIAEVRHHAAAHSYANNLTRTQTLYSLSATSSYRPSQPCAS